MEIIKKFLDLLTPQERNRAVIILVMMIVMALIDMIGVASIVPFMAVISNPQIIETNLILASIYDYLGFQNPHTFMFF